MTAIRRFPPLPPPCPSQIGVGLREFIPRASQIGVHFSDSGSIGVGLKRDVAALCLYPSAEHPSPYPLCTPNSTQGHPIPGAPTRAVFAWGRRHPRIGRGSQPQKDKTQRNPRCEFCSSQIPPNTKYQHQVPAESLS
jgi:hypothetical protein